MLEHHDTLSPSSFPMLAKCPCYKSGEPGEAALSGSRQHKLLSILLDPEKYVSDYDLKNMSELEADQVEWAAEYIRCCTGSTRMIEERMSLIDDDFEEITFGTLDIVDIVDRSGCDQLVIVDYKSGDDYGYLPQMAAYARMAMIRFAKTVCEVHEVYGRGKWFKKYDLSISDTDFILDIIASAQSSDKQPVINTFCKWCDNQGQCHETTKAIVKVATEYEPYNQIGKLPLSNVETWHASKITDPRQMEIVLNVAEYLYDWSKAVKAHANDAAMNGMEIPGYKLNEGRCTRSFADISAAYNASGLEADEFLACCTASVPDVEKKMAEKAGHKNEKIKAAKESFDEAMGNIIVRKQTAPQLVKG